MIDPRLIEEVARASYAANDSPVQGFQYAPLSFERLQPEVQQLYRDRALASIKAVLGFYGRAENITKAMRFAHDAEMYGATSEGLMPGVGYIESHAIASAIRAAGEDNNG